MKVVGIAGFSQETHGFWGVPTGHQHFHRCDGSEIVEVNRNTKSCIAGFIEGIDDLGYEIVPIVTLEALPAGNIIESVYQKLKLEFVEEIKRLLPLDGLLVDLHGAMRSEDCFDCEGDLLSELKAIVGNIPIVATLDLHSNTSDKMFINADALVIYRENPHVDKKERGVEAAKILGQLFDGVILNKVHVKLPLILSPLTAWTKGYPLKAGNDLAQQMRTLPGVISISISGGYCYTDSDILGVSTIVYTDAKIDTENKCSEFCNTVAKSIWDKRNTALFSGFEISQAVAKSIISAKGPILLADLADNIGGGSPGDGTVILEELLKVGAEKAVVVITDKETVEMAYKTGVGNNAEFTIGGKTDTCHGRSLKLTCEVVKLTDGKYIIGQNSHFASFFGSEMRMGKCAILKVGGVTILVNEEKTAPGGPEQLRSQGIIPEEMLIIAVKSAIAFRGGYEDIAEEIIEVNTPGICTCDLSQLPIVKMKDTYYPLNVNVKWNY